MMQSRTTRRAIARPAGVRCPGSCHSCLRWFAAEQLKIDAAAERPISRRRRPPVRLLQDQTIRAAAVDPDDEPRDMGQGS